jgi:hypothetical protein
MVNKGTKNKLRDCLTANIDLAKTKAIQGKKAKFTIMVNVVASQSGKIKQTRPSNHKENKAASILLCTPRNPVQFCTAVNRKSAMMAQPKPKISS